MRQAMKLPLFLLRPLARWVFRHTGARNRLAMWLRPGIRKQVTCYGHQARLDSSFVIDGVYLLLGQYDPAYDDLCKAALQPGCVIVDVGAHTGITLFSALQAVGDQASIYAFEPDPTHYERCLANLRLNPQLQNRVTLIPQLLSDQDCSLDSWVEEQRLTRLDLLKSGVEGHEPGFFRGARRTIERFRPLIFFESLFLNGRAEAPELLKWLEDLGYVLCSSHFPHPYLELGGPYPMDTIACPRERWLELHSGLMRLGQARRRGRSRLRRQVDALHRVD